MKCVMCGGKTTERKAEYQEYGIKLGTFLVHVCENCNEEYYDEKTAEIIQKKSQELNLFGMVRKVKIAEVGNSLAIRIPKDIGKFLNLKKGKEVVVYPDNNQELRIQI